ncbi:hypothetical protein PG996_011437 [Apiospora saccharicola]|uniref:Heterokaryon incompatibility domain-containing protein n=1 Tax=Apiospora saccharicola TaxID=335842 RepID=A0ABR1UHD6_9PEZI
MLGRLLDTDWVEDDLLREWLSECLAEHGQACDDPLSLSRISPAWLMDTTDNCLVDGDGVQDYVALSYRWGTTKHLQNEISTLDSLQQPGAFLHAQFVDLISPTIRHAMGLVRILGERYLWADALCIVQDRGEETAVQLRLMGAIYASAKLTIVAADGDASHGIPGLRGISQPRQLRQIKFPLGQDDHVLIRHKPVFRNADGCTPYFKRAWTYQEYMHSKRRLIVGNNQFHWNCSCMTHHEYMHGADPRSHKLLAQIQFPNILSGIPDFAELNTVAREYNSRELSFEEDALAGVSGLLSVMSRGFAGGFIYGLPEMCFDAALMWKLTPNPQADTAQPGQRRVHSGRNHTILQGSTLPSWSWLGWKGAVSVIDEEHSQDVASFGYSTKRITHWYSQETPSSITPRLIRPTFLDYNFNSRTRSKHLIGLDQQDPNDISSKDTTELLLTKGWKREHFNNPSIRREFTSRLPVPILGKYIYKHLSLPGRHFWRPFPVKHEHAFANWSMPPQHPFLSCDTKRGWFMARINPRDEYYAAFSHVQVCTMGRKKKECGYIQVSSTEYRTGFPTIDSDEGRTIELVAVCLRKRPGFKQVERVKGRFFKCSKFYQEYGVLWVEWVDGVAYRKGAGYIDKRIWDTQRLEDVHLMLG